MCAHELQSGYIEILFRVCPGFHTTFFILFLLATCGPFLPPRRIVSIRQTFVFFCLMSWQYHQSNESLMTAGNPYTFQFNGRDSVTKDVTKRSVGNIYLYQDTNDRPATC